MKEGSDVFKLGRYMPAFLFAGVAQHCEVRGSNLNPILIAVARPAWNPQNQEEAQGHG
jgi:hypothetical protein